MSINTCGSRVKSPRDIILHLAFGVSIGYLLGLILFFDGDNDVSKHIHLVEHDKLPAAPQQEFYLRCVIVFHRLTYKPQRILSAFRDGYTKMCNETIFFTSNKTFYAEYEKPDEYTMVYLKTTDNHYYWHFYQYLLEYSAKVPAKWTFMGDDQTYLVVPNLRRAVANFDSDKPIVFGKVRDTSNILSWIFPYSGNHKVSIRAGAVFTNAAIDSLSKCKGFFFARSSEYALYECSENFGVQIVDTFDEDGLRLFNEFPPRQIIAPDPKLFRREPIQGGKCSDHSVTFGQISDKDMRVMEFGMSMKVFGRGSLEMAGSNETTA